MREEIIRRLKQIEEEESVTIDYACESGSRAWGFPSADSDYDVRFIYHHPRDWYLSIDLEDKSDVIERPINDELDISGWDLRKALQLLRKSNPPLLEWLSSPIVYIDSPRGLGGVGFGSPPAGGGVDAASADGVVGAADGVVGSDGDKTVAQQLRSAVDEFYSPISSHYHYLSMAKGNIREHLKDDLVRVKKYFYILRPLLAIRWIQQDIGPVPMEFEKLVDRCVDSPEVKQAIALLLERKKSGQELDREPKITVLSDFIQSEFAHHEKTAPPVVGPRSDIALLNQIFRSAIYLKLGFLRPA